MPHRIKGAKEKITTVTHLGTYKEAEKQRRLNNVRKEWTIDLQACQDGAHPLREKGGGRNAESGDWNWGVFPLHSHPDALDDLENC